MYQSQRAHLTIFVSGMIARVPGQGGAAWSVLQYLLGLQRLGHAIYFVEQLDEGTLRPVGATLNSSHNADYFRQTMIDFGLQDAAALLLAGTRQTVGLPYRVLHRAARRADLLINISGILTQPDLIEHIPIRVYLDLDPAFTQIWNAAQGIDMGFADHTHFATVGLAIGRPGCHVPACGREWIPTLQPGVLSHWPVSNEIAYDALTTVANWRGYGSIAHNGAFYGQKAHSLRQFLKLSTLTEEKFTLALAIHPDEREDLAALSDHGWRLLDPARVAYTPTDYQRFIQGSKAEFGFAKAGYVTSRCGWFSDRSICYLASGRPVIAQETGFTDFLPSGAGLFAFQTIDDILAAIDAINSDYTRHARAARAMAVDYFDSDKVLTRLLRRVGATP